MKKGKLSHKGLNAFFHRIDSILHFEMWEHNECGEDLMIVVNNKNDTYIHTCDDFRTTINNIDDYTWYKFKE